MTNTQFEAEADRRAELRERLEQVLRGMVEHGLVEAGEATRWVAYSDGDLAIYASCKTAELAHRWVLEDIEKRTQLEKAA